MKPADGDEPSVPTTDESQAPFALPDNAAALVRLHDEAGLHGRTDWFAFGTTYLNLTGGACERSDAAIPDAFFEHVDPAVVGDISCPAATAGIGPITAAALMYDELARERTGKHDGVLPAEEARELWQQATEDTGIREFETWYNKVTHRLGW